MSQNWACQVFNKQLCLLNMSTRKYTKTRRAQQESQTRERIVEALVELHQELGPANTSVKAVAEKAGVQRLTVYRYFPDEVSMLQACSTHWWGLNPPPGIDQWANIENSADRCAAAFTAFYRYYHQTEDMWKKLYRDVGEIESLKKIMMQYENILDDIRDDLLAAWKAKGKRKQQLSLTIRHCLAFSTWQSLKEAKLNDSQMANLVVSWLKPN